MKIIKSFNPIYESISKVGSKGGLKENLGIQPTLPPADAEALNQHIEDRKAGLERRAHPEKDSLVKELIEETALEKSRTLHYDVVDRKELAKILKEAKDNNLSFRVKRSIKEGFRYDVDIMSKESLNEDVEIEGKYNLLSFEDAKKYVKDKLGIDLTQEAYEKMLKQAEDKVDLGTDSLTEAINSKWVVDNPDYIKSMYDGYKELKKRKTAFGAVIGFKKGDRFLPLLAIKSSPKELADFVNAVKTKEKGSQDVEVYTMYKDKLDDYEDLLIEKGLLEKDSVLGENLDKILEAIETDDEAFVNEHPEDFIYQVDDNETFDTFEDAMDFVNENKDASFIYRIQKENPDKSNEETNIIPDKLVWERPKSKPLSFEKASALIKDKFGGDLDWDTYNKILSLNDDNTDESEELDEDLKLYTSTLKDFKPAKEAQDLWNELVNKNKLDDLEYELENVFKDKDSEESSIDVNGLNDLLINHPDFIRTLVGLDDEEDDEEPVDNEDLIIDDEENIDPNDVELSDLEDDDDVNYKDIGSIDDEDDEEIEPIDYEEKKSKKYTRMQNDESDEDAEDIEPLDDKDEGKDKEKKEKELKEDIDTSIIDHKEPCPENELCLSKELDKEEDEDLIGDIAEGFIKKNFVDTTKKEDIVNNIPLSNSSEDEDEVVDVSDDDLEETFKPKM